METTLIFKNILANKEFAKKVMPFLKHEYFEASKVDKEIFKSIEKYYNGYGALPTVETIETDIKNAVGFSQDEFNHAQDVVQDLGRPFKQPDVQWLLDQTEEFCLGQSAYNGVIKALSIIDGSDKKTPKTAIPDILREALAISFDTAIGHEYVADIEYRYKKLHENTSRIKFDLDGLNNATGGGLPRKTMSIFMGGPGAGKSLVMTHIGTSMYKVGSNVLYVTLELSEERIGERVDANLINTFIKDIPDIPLENYKAKILKATSNTKGARFFIKEYPPASISTAHIRALLDELESKQNFVPDILIVDYLNLLNSSRYSAGGNNNSYTILKAVAEELRGLAVEKNMACITATQSNRAGVGSSDLDLTNVSESMGIAMTADLLIGLTRNDELDALGQLLMKILKTRFSDLTNHRFVCGIELAKMRLSNIMAQDSVQQSNYRQPDSNDNKGAFVKPDIKRDDKKSRFSQIKV
jgi:KaiC/GvpD/RAD55 family RecA-like ATPase